jgi:Type IV secretion system pilin
MKLATLAYVASASAICLTNSDTGNGTCDTGLPSASASGSLTSLLQVVFAVFGAIAVLMIVIAGLNFVTAQGDPSKVAKARNTIIYALVGLVIAVSAEAFVTFVIGRI